MDALVAMEPDRRRRLCDEAGHLLGLSAGSVDKDFWACWLLRLLFRLRSSGLHLTFKGGTSLSKGWKLIQRFSEDLDVVIDRRFLGAHRRGGTGDVAEPEAAREAPRRPSGRVPTLRA
jgi:predicted nucleotidyltransferase component of viral defense system